MGRPELETPEAGRRFYGRVRALQGLSQISAFTLTERCKVPSSPTPLGLKFPSICLPTLLLQPLSRASSTQARGLSLPELSQVAALTCPASQSLLAFALPGLPKIASLHSTHLFQLSIQASLSILEQVCCPSPSADAIPPLQHSLPAAWSHSPTKPTVPQRSDLPSPGPTWKPPPRHVSVRNISALCFQTSLDGRHLSFWIFSLALPQACVAKRFGAGLGQAGSDDSGGPSLTGKHMTCTTHSSCDFASPVPSSSGPGCEGSAARWPSSPGIFPLCHLRVPKTGSSPQA